jgi:integrase/recombinase XerD
VLSVAEVDRLLRAPQPGGMYQRDRTALELLYACGARASEVVGLDVGDIRERTTLLRLRGKGSKERMVPVGEEARRQLRRYLRDLRPQLVNDGRGGDALLLGARGGRLRREQLWEIVRTAAALAGIRKRVFTHLLRHSFATHMIENGADLRVVQELLGHANMTTTQRYTHVDARRLRAVHERFHPRA